MAAKRSLFNRPAWAAKEKHTTDEIGGSIFQQNVYEEVLRENQKKQERRSAKQRRKGEANGHAVKAVESEQPAKKRRISKDAHAVDSEEEDINDDERNFLSGHSDSDSGSATVQLRKPSQSKRGSVRHDRTRETSPALQKSPQKPDKTSSGEGKHVKNKSSRIPRPISDDELVVIEEISAKPSPKKPDLLQKKKALPESESDSETDEYVRELKRAARAEARSKKIQAVQEREASESNTRSPSTAAPGSSHTLHSLDQRNSNTPTPVATNAADPEVVIRVKTIIPGCNEIFVKRKASQTLEGLEKYFVETHKLTDQLRQKIFFTWNLQRLYKSTTMSSILAQIKSKHGTNLDGSDRSEGRIELEAVTVEIFEHRKKQQERERKAANGDHEDEPSLSDTAADMRNGLAETTDDPPVRRGIVIHLKSNNEQELPHMALRVHPDTQIAKIIRGYKSKMKVDQHTKIYLMFDGDRLEGDHLVGDVGFENEDSVDIAIEK